jgi:hypothetical protein
MRNGTILTDMQVLGVLSASPVCMGFIKTSSGAHSTLGLMCDINIFKTLNRVYIIFTYSIMQDVL